MADTVYDLFPGPWAERSRKWDFSSILLLLFSRLLVSVIEVRGLIEVKGVALGAFLFGYGFCLHFGNQFEIDDSIAVGV